MKTVAILPVNGKCACTPAGFPDDSQQYMDMLRLAGGRFRFAVIPVHDGEWPGSVSEFDGYIITGRSASVNGTDAWLPRLFELVREIKTKGIPLFGSCFGHHAVAKALGGEVSANPFGWSVGSEVMEFVRREWWTPEPGRSLRLYSAYEEQVTRLPPGARVVGTNDRCPIAAAAVGESIFTTQYSPEMTPDFIAALAELMKAELGEDSKESRRRLQPGSEMKAFAECVAAFLEQARPNHEADNGGETALRRRFAEEASAKAGRMALEYYSDIASLEIHSKGVQDPVTDADRAVETLIRGEIAAEFPGDGIIGEEYGTKRGSSGFDWVIDPIDGTSNFARGIPAWTVAIACLRHSLPVIGVLLDPVHNEHFVCCRSRGAFLNGQPIQTSGNSDLSEGLMGIGTSYQTGLSPVPALTDQLLKRDSMFVRNGSGALGLAYVACGRYLGYMEDHMNSWDCLAGILLAEEAGAITHNLDYKGMLSKGGRVVVAVPGVFHAVCSVSRSVFGA